MPQRNLAETYRVIIRRRLDEDTEMSKHLEGRGMVRFSRIVRACVCDVLPFVG